MQKNLIQKIRNKFFDEVIIKGSVFPYYETRFGNWMDENGEYQIDQIAFAIRADRSNRNVAIDIRANVGLHTRI